MKCLSTCKQQAVQQRVSNSKPRDDVASCSEPLSSLSEIF